MRILLVIGSYYPELQFGGSTQKIYELSLELVERGHDVQVVTFHSDKTVGAGRAKAQGVDVQYLPWIGRGSWRVPMKLRLLYRAIRESDVVHCFGLYSLLCAAAAFGAKRCKRPYFLEPLGMYVPRGRNLLAKKIYNVLFTGWMMRMATAVIATSPTESEELSTAVSKSRLTVRRDGIRPSTFRNCAGRETFRRQFGIGEAEKIVLYVGRICRIKNLEQLILAFKSASIANSRLILVGPKDEPDYEEKLHRIIDSQGLRERILFVGPLYEDAKLPAFAAADLFVLPSHYESYGIAAAEAVAVGLPVLITNTCGIAPLINGRAGLSVPADTEELAKAMRALLEDDIERERVTAHRFEVLNDLTWEKPLEQLESLYKQGGSSLAISQDLVSSS